MGVRTIQCFLSVAVAVGALILIGCASINLTSDPAGAEIRCNRKLLGETPAKVYVSFFDNGLPGNATLVVSKKGYRPEIRRLAIGSVVPSQMHFILRSYDRGTISEAPLRTNSLGDLSDYPHRGSTAAILTFDSRAGMPIDQVALLADRFAVELGRIDVYKVISRSKMKEVLSEQRFSVDCSSAECAVEAGKLLSAEYMIYGSIGRIGSLFTINVYIASVETGGIVGEATVDYTGQIEGLLTEGMQQAVQNLLEAVNDRA